VWIYRTRYRRCVATPEVDVVAFDTASVHPPSTGLQVETLLLSYFLNFWYILCSFCEGIEVRRFVDCWLPIAFIRWSSGTKAVVVQSLLIVDCRLRLGVGCLAS